MLRRKLEKIKIEAAIWAKDRYFGLFGFNIIIVLLSLLHTAHYFDPIYAISINFIFAFAMILAVLFLGVRSKALFIIALFFLGVAIFFESIKIDIWAERSGIYTFDAFTLGVIVLIFENIKYNLKSFTKSA